LKYGFVIDNRTCIGCHACSTACKSENDVSLGVYRTWVKNTEVGTYPDVTRRFQVTRCNHCENPPCVRICPVSAMYQKDNGIVEFNQDICIACKGCIQACPYDSIHIDPETNSAAKCHYCSHRVEKGLEPSCVVVCPTHSIIAGDMSDPVSEISKLLAKEKVTVRRPEQGTAPKLFYIDGDAHSMVPTASNPTPEGYMWAEQVGEKKYGGNYHGQGDQLTTTSLGDTIRVPGEQGAPQTGVVPSQTHDESYMGQKVQVAYNVQHKVYWHWPVPAYLVTKGMAAGPMIILSLLYGLKVFPYNSLMMIGACLFAVLFLSITTALLVYDLEKPHMFLTILLRFQSKSWIARGSFFLIGLTNITLAWGALELLVHYGYLGAGLSEILRPWFMLLTFPMAIGATVYTAFLFGQCEGRDLWQSAALPFHLFVQATMLGSGILLVMSYFINVSDNFNVWMKLILMIFLVIDLLFQWAEFSIPHASENATRAAHAITGGEFKVSFWLGNIVLGHALPLVVILFMTGIPMSILGLLMVIGGLYAYEYAFVTAPQKVPNS
jgi:Fe-S-cluster-containing dehydrogenase component/formate-dependent nitrite reductase membrane component NrfD